MLKPEHREVIKALKKDGETSYKGHSFIFDDVTNDVEVQHEGQYFVTLNAQWELEEFLEGLEEQ